MNLASYQIVWPNLDAIVNDGEPLTEPAPVPAEFTVNNSETPAPVLDDELTQVLKEGGDHCDHPPDHDDQPPAHSDQPPPDHHDQASIYPLININNHPPSHNPTWLVVENDLRSLGVGRAAQAVETAQGRGCSAEEIRQLITYARSKPGAYGPGAICKRITEAFPGRDPAEGWPPEDPQYQKVQRQKQAQYERSQDAQGVAEIQSRRKANQQARETLERNFGPLLDGMSEAEHSSLARECGPIVFRKMNRDPAAFQSGEFRLILLTKLKARQAECLVNSTSTDVEGSTFVE